MSNNIKQNEGVLVLFDFESLFQFIEENLRGKIALEDMTKAIRLSTVHLNRLFKFAYGMTAAEYVRKRKLSESLKDLLKQDKSVLEVALEYGFEYEQSYARAFKREFGMTPGKYRKERPVLKMTPEIRNFGIVCKDGLLFGPEMVMMPRIQLVGVEHKIPYKDSEWMAPKVALEFWDGQKNRIKGVGHAKIFYGLTRLLGRDCDYSKYLTAVEVKEGQDVPGNMLKVPFGGCLCLRFHYVGKHHYREISSEAARGMYSVIESYFTENPQMYKGIHLEKIDTTMYDGEYCLMEWFVPCQHVDKKSSL